MKKRLISLLVALCMAVTLLPVSALTAWAEGGDQLRIVDGYPVGSGGEGWSYDGTTLDLHPASSTEYDFLSIISGNGNVTKCKLTIGGNATIVRGNFDNTVINNGKISGGYFYSSSPLTNHGTIIDGLFVSAVSNESEGKIENGTFRSTVTNNGIIKGGIFSEQPAGGTVASGYTLNINFPENGSYEIIDAGISYFGNSGYVIPNSNHNTSISIYIFFRDSQAILFPIDVTFGDTHCLLEDWAPSARYYDNGSGYFSVTFTAPPAKADTVTLSKLTRLVIDENGYPVGTKGGTQGYSGDGWNFDASKNTLTLTSGRYDFSALRSLSSDVHLVVDGATIVNPEPKPDPKPEPKPDPKPEPEPDPTPETSTYTLTVKGGTFTYNGGEAMTSANVPVDAEVKVTLNQSAVPEGMVFDLWAMDGASLLGNPAVAYNEESFTIPAGSVAKGSTVTVEAQYRDATIESEPSVLGTAAIIGVAGAGTAVIVWQGYRIGMELYEKYFQPTPEETVVEEPALEGQMIDPIS